MAPITTSWIIDGLVLISTPEQFVKDLYAKSAGEKMFGFYIFDKPYLMLRDTDLIKDVFIKDFHNFSNKIAAGNDYDKLGDKSVFLTKNPPWKHIRPKLSPIFTSGKLKKMFQLMLEICHDFGEYLENLEIDDKIGKPIEVKEMFAKFTTDLIGTTAFGMKFNSLLDPNAEFRKRGKQIFETSYRRYLELIAIFLAPPLRIFTKPTFFEKNNSKFLSDTFWNVINHRMTTGIKRADFIDLLIDIKKSQDDDFSNSYKLDDDDLVAQAAIFFSGGFETSATTSSFVLYEIAKNQEIQTKLRNEILNGLEETSGKITYELVTNMPYADMVIQESMRIYPILSWLDRVAENDYTFSGTDITIKKGTPVILPTRALQMDPELFHDPEIFDPERFSPENKGSIVPMSYFPFGKGPRNCVGGRLGMIQIKLALIKVLSKYEISHCKDTVDPIVLDNFTIFTLARGDLFLNLRKISS
ncbi:hypothetical protein QAD02_019490 [Eretmocerus hayati]|uniref:Uncharacterized protein n=1 Tax=Eretmocerus hayati TaxID=131215 RepID=A0ACC2PKW2_9HYME|nr:hypothetical protein QAD02_019490 [Eretmocerus hayati]